MPSPFEFPTDNPELFTARPPSVFPRAAEPVTAPAPVAVPVPVPAAAPVPVPVPVPVAAPVPVPVAVAAPVADDDADIEIVDSFDDADFQADFAPAPVIDPVAVFLSQLTTVALAAGAPMDAVAMLGGMLGFDRLDVSRASDQTLQSLVGVGLLSQTDGDWVRADAVVTIAQAWRVAIAGGDPDLSVCGSKMLDEWSADIVAKLAGAPHKLEVVRRDLRARGVAAFGLLIEAA